MKPTDIRIKDVSFAFEDHRYRTPIKFGGVALDRCTLLNVEITVETAKGRSARGFGSMPLGNVWSFPSQKLRYEDTLGAMQDLAARVRDILAASNLVAHPIDITWTLEDEYFKAAREVAKRRKPSETIPKLCTLVVASPFDAAMHDAFGKVHRLNCYHTYGPDFLSHDLSYYLGKEFDGEQLLSYITTEPQPRMPLYHLVGALDPLEQADVTTLVNDGLPETLAEWIVYNGLTHIKIKLNGEDQEWDVNRILSVNKVCELQQKKRKVKTWHYSLDFNEKCPSAESLVTLLLRVQGKSQGAYDRVAYIEQPTKRDLAKDRKNTMHEAAKLRPVVIDESLLDLKSLQLAREMGYTGAALKACKGQTQSLLMAAAAQKYDMFLCVQDLTCPGASLIQSASLAAHVPGVSAIEANARQYCPVANRGWEERFPGIFEVRDGRMDTSVLNGVGLGAVAE